MFLIRKMLNVFLNTIRKNALILLNFDLGQRGLILEKEENRKGKTYIKTLGIDFISLIHQTLVKALLSKENGVTFRLESLRAFLN